MGSGKQKKVTDWVKYDVLLAILVVLRLCTQHWKNQRARFELGSFFNVGVHRQIV